MKFEKLNENKLRIIISSQDLIEKHIYYGAHCAPLRNNYK